MSTTQSINKKKQKNVVLGKETWKEIEAAWLKEVWIENFYKAWDKAKKNVVADVIATQICLRDAMWISKKMITNDMMKKVTTEIKQRVATKIIIQLMVTLNVHRERDNHIRLFVAKMLAEIKASDKKTEMNTMNKTELKEDIQNTQKHIDLEVPSEQMAIWWSNNDDECMNTTFYPVKIW